MLKDMKEVVVAQRQGQETQAEQAEPMYSEEFVRMVQDHAYETLRRHLERTKQVEAVKLLDDLIMLSIAAYKGRVSWIDNQIMSEAIGSASHHVLALGGRFYSSSEMMAPYE